MRILPNRKTGTQETLGPEPKANLRDEKMRDTLKYKKVHT